MAKNKSKRRSNPMTRQNRVSRPKMSFNGQVLQSFSYLPLGASAGDGAASSTFKVDCTYSTASIGYSVSGITQHYKEYAYRVLRCEWIPTIGPASSNAGSVVYLTYDDNPEHMATYIGGSAAANIARQLLDSSTKIFNAWERVTFNIPLTRRRKTFDVNSTNDNSVDVLDRSTQALIVTGANTAVVSTSIGYWKFSYHLELHGLSSVST